ncbi:hypothetical protein EJ02DRAFT_428181 [Clathrospora elynae]|uniref:Uncharacterized protein n=1 Tax=Clathrospora elynae TaxID=706981 RepID=A0A6A5S6H7_9PLEO|nr:hypothetical protein EJ02DRAFT_428181 [Clathrospora elynae]
MGNLLHSTVQYVQAKNVNLGQQLEIMDAELIAIHKALSNLHKLNTQNQDIHVNNNVSISWVLEHKDIQGNKHADKLAKAGLKRKARNPPTSLSYLKRKAKEDILAR